MEPQASGRVQLETNPTPELLQVQLFSSSFSSTATFFKRERNSKPEEIARHLLLVFVFLSLQLPEFTLCSPFCNHVTCIPAH